MKICVAITLVLRYFIIVFTSMEKGEIVEKFVVIDVNP